VVARGRAAEGVDEMREIRRLCGVADALTSEVEEEVATEFKDMADTEAAWGRVRAGKDGWPRPAGIWTA
jgi:hypothetical protein